MSDIEPGREEYVPMPLGLIGRVMHITLGGITPAQQSFLGHAALHPIAIMRIAYLDPADPGEDQDRYFAVGWRAGALLAGQLEIMRDRMSVHQRDQWDATVAEVRRAGS